MTNKFVSEKQRKFVMMRLKQAGFIETPIKIEARGRNFRARIKDPKLFKKKSFVTLDVGRKGKTQVIRGIPKGKTKFEAQSILVEADSKIMDSDCDNIVDAKDCCPFDPKKQGKLHDLAVNILKRKEQFLENRRKKQMAKLEAAREKLLAKREVIGARNKKLAAKQAVINEIDKERKQIQDLKAANKKVKDEIFRQSTFARGVRATARGLGKGVEVTKITIKKSKAAIKKTTQFLNKLDKLSGKL